ncbi:hypothetical protein VN0244_06690 [Helicobacter pylori]|nr:hypothetical protein VN0244_06690 [Helicobacter pylori]
MKTKELVISQAEFLNNAVLWVLRGKTISKYPLSLEKQVLNKLKKMNFTIKQSNQNPIFEKIKKF